MKKSILYGLILAVGTLVPISIAQDKGIDQPAEEPYPLTMTEMRQAEYNRLVSTVYEEIDWKDKGVGAALMFIMVSSNSIFDIGYTPDETGNSWIGVDATWGINPSNTVTIKARNITALDLLERVLDQISILHCKYTWQLDVGNQVMIGSEYYLASDYNTRIEVYDISDILFEPIDYNYAPQIDLQAALSNQLPIVDPLNQKNIDNPSDYQKLVLLQRIIYENIYPNQWISKGGYCSIMVLDHQLIVKAPDFIHREIAGYNWDKERREND